MGIEKENADIVQRNLYYMSAVALFKLFQEVYRVLCMAQGQEDIFGKVSFVTTPIACLLVALFVGRMHLGIGGWVLAKAIYEVMNLATAVYVVATKTVPETRSLCSMAELRDGFWAFFVDNLRYVVGSYGEYIGYECCSYFIAVRKNND